jgi:hypothetical protein
MHVDMQRNECSQFGLFFLEPPKTYRLTARRLIIFFGSFAVLLALSTLGTAFAAAKLAKDTSTTDTNLLVVKGTDRVVATNTHGDNFQVTTLDASSLSERRLVSGDDVTATTNTKEESLIARTIATNIHQMCDQSENCQPAASLVGISGLASFHCALSVPVRDGPIRRRLLVSLEQRTLCHYGLQRRHFAARLHHPW